MYNAYIMTYNLHPIIVHFPIAMLFLYSIIKIIPLNKWFPNVSWKQIERVLLLVGVLGAFAALYTGDTARHMMRPDHALVEMHSLFATISTWIYGLLLLGEFLSIYRTSNIPKLNSPQVTQFFLFVEKILTNPALSKIMAFLGLVAITVTGMLGGVMIYGTSADPMASTVLKILGLN